MKNGIIAFCGEKESGKDTSAEILSELVDANIEKIAFAMPLKVICSKVFKMDMSLFQDTKLKEKELDTYVNLTEQNIVQVLKEFKITEYDYDTHIRPHIGQVFETPRQLLQYIGTDVLHPLDPLIHVKTALGPKDPNKLTLVTDLRFPQEFEALQAYENVITVHVVRAAAGGASKDTHKSETSLKSFAKLCSYQLDNNGTKEQLRHSLGLIFKKICKQPTAKK